MMERLRVDRAIVVEGRYDAAKLRALVDGVVIETGGFRIFSEKEKLALLRRLAAERGLVILTDSDGAGFVIRNFLRGAIPPEQVLHAYIPDIAGKERRKDKPSREGKLGVEGMSLEVLRDCLSRAGALAETVTEPRPDPVTKADLYAAGLSGCPGSEAARARFLSLAGLPARMTAGALLEMINTLYSREEFEKMAEKCR